MKPPIHLENREQSGARLFSPTAARNREAIGDVIIDYLPQGARVLEIASGSGEHGVHMCGLRPDIIWQTSDPNEASRASQNDWIKECSGNMLPSLNIDTTVTDWAKDLNPYDAIYCANMIHIAPWEACIGLAKGASKLLSKNRKLMLYGPILEGDETAESNLKFDETLKARNAAWGVRKLDSVKHIFNEHSFTLDARIVMPKENRTLIFTKSQ